MTHSIRVFAAAAIVMSLALIPFACKREAPPPPATRPTTKPATLPATKPATTQYTDVLREHYPKFPATQPLDVTVDLKDAGHYVLPEPIYICPRGDLWITRADAPATPTVLKTANDQQIHLTRERVRYVQWSVDDEGKPVTRIVIDAISGTEAWVDGDHSFPTKIGHYRWDAALSFNNTIVVPSARGVSIFTFTAATADGDPPKINETYQETVKTPDANPPQILLDPRGVIAWSPCDDQKSAASGAWRFADDKWTDLSADPNWTAKFIHLVPLLDGSVLQLIRKDDGKLALALSPLDTPQLDETALNQLIDQLSDDDPDKRNAAYAQLTRYGPASWPILEKKLNDQPPEAQMRMQQLLRNRIQPTLGGRTLVDGTAKVVSRFDDGGILLHTAAGVSIPKQDKPPEIVKPAWLSIRPGMAIELLDPVLVKDADPSKQHVFAFDNEWIIADPVQGPRRLFGNHLEPMLNKDESTFTTVIGYDRRGRWLFRKSPDAKETLILDPTLPDLTPRLPVWLMAVDQGSTGWTGTGWPAIKRGGAWALSESGWRPLDEKKEPMLKEVPKTLALPIVISTSHPAITTTSTQPTTLPTTLATTKPTTIPTTESAFGPPILIDRDGRKWFDGNQSLHVVDPDGKITDWPLPANAASDSATTPTLLQITDGTLFLFNQSGRVVRIKRTPSAIDPFAVEAVFTHRIPTSDHIKRIWLDPADRIIVAYDGNRLAILFPQGRIPTEIANMIPVNETDQQP